MPYTFLHASLRRAVVYHAKHEALEAIAGLRGLKRYILVVEIVLVNKLAQDIGIAAGRPGLISSRVDQVSEGRAGGSYFLSHGKFGLLGRACVQEAHGESHTPQASRLISKLTHSRSLDFRRTGAFCHRPFVGCGLGGQAPIRDKDYTNIFPTDNYRRCDK